MTDRPDIGWSACAEDGCIGARLARGGRCLAHAATRRRNAALKQFAKTGEIDARGVPITDALLRQVLAAAPHDAEDHPAFIAARFDRATFQGDADFATATFQGDAWFLGATFRGDAMFDDATFQGVAAFARATFQGDAVFYRATFQDAQFHQTTFRGDAGFHGATFRGGATFYRATFRGDAGFHGATFRGGPRFHGATFQGDAKFDGAIFRGDAEFDGAIFRGDAGFHGARFEQARQLGPFLVYGALGLDAAHFAQFIQIEASARGLSCQRTQFPAGVQFRLCGAHIVLDDADFTGPSLLVGIDALSDARLARREQRLAPMPFG
jgi:uncharacterized protein YjbI with pentapeptide repeats